MYKQQNSINIKTENQGQISPNKFQRIGRNNTKTTPSQTLATSEKAQSIITQNLQKSPSQLEKSKPFSRTNKITQKIELKNETIVEQSPIISKKLRLKTSPNQELVITPKNQLKFTSKIPQIIAKSAQNQIQLSFNQNKVSEFSQRNILTERQKMKTQPIQTKVMLSPRQLKKILTAHTKILYYCMSQTHKRLLLTFQKIAFNNIKLIILKYGKQNYNISNQSLKLNMKKCKESLINLVHLLYRAKFKISWDSLKNNKIKRQLYQKNVRHVFNLFGKIKIKRNYQDFFELIKIKVPRRVDLLNSFAVALAFCNRQKQNAALQKIYNTYAALKSTQSQQIANPVKNDPIKQTSNKKIVPSPISMKNLPIINNSSDLTNKKQKVEQQINLRNQEISSLQDNIKDKKRYLQIQSKKLKKKIQDLSKQKQKNANQLKQKNKRKQKIKNEIQNFTKNKNKTENIPQDNKNSSQLFKIMQQIYIKIQRIPINQNFRQITQQILQQNSPSTRKIPTNIVQQWINIRKRKQLQNQITKYEKSILGNQGNQINNDHYLNLKQENGLVVCMTKNLIKEKYYWKEIQNFVSTIM